MTQSEWEVFYELLSIVHEIHGCALDAQLNQLTKARSRRVSERLSELTEKLEELPIEEGKK